MTDINLSEEARQAISRLNHSFDSMAQACTVLGAKVDKLDQHIVKLYTMIDEDLGPLLDETSEMIGRIDGVANTIIEASKSNVVSKRSAALDALEKIQEIFRIFR